MKKIKRFKWGEVLIFHRSLSWNFAIHVTEKNSPSTAQWMFWALALNETPGSDDGTYAKKQSEAWEGTTQTNSGN